MTQERGLAHGLGAAQANAGGTSWLGRFRRRLQRNGARLDVAHALYHALVEQARRPVLYTELHVPDSRDGRLELIYLHAILLMRRLRSEGSAGQELAQDLFDLLFRDVDRHLREWGVGDLSVGKHVKALAQSFFGRATALDGPLSDGDHEAISEVLWRNVYAEVAEPDPAAVAGLADYLLAQDRWLASQAPADLLAGRPAFAPGRT
ncbi:MAG: ubiquinol-cytochrome C chaperone family protein [Geminicoccaceae bacterium]